jgi:hypothetical protein
MINLDKVSEGIDYELIPVDYVDNEAAWDVRILRGVFSETVLRYGTIKFDGERDCLTFDFRVVTSPDMDLDSNDLDLQQYAGEVLEDILERGIQEGWVYGTEQKTGDGVGNTTGTDDSTESTD